MFVNYVDNPASFRHQMRYGSVGFEGASPRPTGPRYARPGNDAS